MATIANFNQSLLDTALAYREAGRDVIPDHPIEKYPVGFKGWEQKNFTEEELRDCIINKGYGIGLRNQEGLDFDNHGNPGAEETIENWKKLVDAICPGLVDRLLIEKTQHKGFHAAWKCEVIEGNQKLASREATEEELINNPKEKIKCFIETRGTGGQFVVSPTPGYKVLQGDWCNLPTITPEERKILLDCAKSLDLMPATTEDFKASGNNFDGDRPGDLFNKEGADEALKLLKQAGWTTVFEQGNTVYLRRPGKDKGISATFGYVAPGIFYNFTSNGSPFEPNKAYTPFAIFSLLKHNGDFSSAASELAKRYGLNEKVTGAPKAPKIPWPSPLNEAAYYGLVGKFANLIEPHSEADPVFLITGFLTAFGNVIGEKPYFLVERTKHKMKLDTVHVGVTAKGRKGTAWDQVRPIFDYVDPSWSKNIVNGGLATGEGLINAVRDPVTKIKEGQEVITEDGVKDKRLLVIESEFASVLKVMSREHNILSPILRSAWDRGDLRTLTKGSPLKATGSHISIVGHIVKDELLKCLNSIEMANGFGNRILFIMGKRSKELPLGGNVPYLELEHLTKEITVIFDKVKDFEEITFDDEARELWIKIYHELSAEEPGIIGSMSARIEPYTLRLACIYTLLDGSDKIKIEHLRAAIAIIDYYYESLIYLFGHISGDPLADEIITALMQGGMSREGLNDYFGGHRSSEELTSALESLEQEGIIKPVVQKTPGRDKTTHTLSQLPQPKTSGKNFLKKLDEYIELLGFNKESSTTVNNAPSGVSGVSPEGGGVKNPLNTLPGLERYGH